MKEHEMGKLPLGKAFRHVVIVPRILVYECLLGHYVLLSSSFTICVDPVRSLLFPRPFGARRPCSN